MKKPFLILQLREMDGPANSEFKDFLRYGGLDNSEVIRIRMDKESFGHLNPEDFAAIIVGGGPSNISDNEDEKSAHQKRYENELLEFYPKIFDKDIPFLGSCYGFGSIAAYAGARISKESYSEEVGFTDIKLSDNAKFDPLLKGLPDSFRVFCGHKEACQNLPNEAILLAGSDSCPIQMIRFKENIYALQFHCELDAKGIADRIRYYKNHGYFKPEEAEKLIDNTKGVVTKDAHRILKRFVDRYKE